MDRWAGKVALVTGASVGIGAKIARELAKNGMKVIAVARRFDKLQELAASIKLEFKVNVYPAQCDVQKEEDILKVFKWAKEKLGGVDVLVNNAAVMSTEPIIEGSTTTYRNIMDVNVIATAICSREFVKSIKERNTSGHIINISSVAGHYAESIPMPINLYGASKYAITGMAASMRTELALTNLDIKVTNISPGAVETDMLLNAFPEAKEKKLPTLNSKDIADAVVYVLGTPQHVQICEMIMMPHDPSNNVLLQFK